MRWKGDLVVVMVLKMPSRMSIFRRKLSIVLNAEEVSRGREESLHMTTRRIVVVLEREILVEGRLWERAWKVLKAEDVEIVTGPIPEPRR